jgi:hypothetical protein
MQINDADVAELVDARDLKSLDGNVVWVRLPPPAPIPTKQDGGAMPDDQDDPFNEDGDEPLSDFDRLTEALFQHVIPFAEEEEIPDDMLSALLLRLSLTSRMVAYAGTAAKPSGAGLKLDLERFRRDIDNIIRETKKDADRFVAHAKESIAAAELDEDEG